MTAFATSEFVPSVLPLLTKDCFVAGGMDQVCLFFSYLPATACRTIASVCRCVFGRGTTDPHASRLIVDAHG